VAFGFNASLFAWLLWYHVSLLPRKTSNVGGFAITSYVNKIWLPYRQQAARDTHES